MSQEGREGRRRHRKTLKPPRFRFRQETCLSPLGLGACVRARAGPWLQLPEMRQRPSNN